MHLDEDRLAAHLLDAADRGRLIEDRQRARSLTMADASGIAALISRQRQARGEQPAGYKIGFTNRSIWPLYGVDTPIWGPMYDTSIETDTSTTRRIASHRYVQARLEPELVLGLRHAPVDEREASLVDAIAWVAHGFEIVQSVYPDWQFSAAESQAAQALHAALLLGPRHMISAAREQLSSQLAQVRLVLERLDDGQWQPVESGLGANVLDGPVNALAYLSEALRKSGRSLAAGDIITTGTLTDAQPLLPEQQWRTRLLDRAGLDGLADLELRID